MALPQMSLIADTATSKLLYPETTQLRMFSCKPWREVQEESQL